MYIYHDLAGAMHTLNRTKTLRLCSVSFFSLCLSLPLSSFLLLLLRAMRTLGSALGARPQVGCPYFGVSAKQFQRQVLPHLLTHTPPISLFFFFFWLFPPPRGQVGAMPHSPISVSLGVSLPSSSPGYGEPFRPPGKRPPKPQTWGCVCCQWFPEIRSFFVGVRCPLEKDYSILGSMLGTPYFGKLPCFLFLSHVYPLLCETTMFSLSLSCVCKLMMEA